ncbi:peptidoglycan D,D-transpeptidase FtsI family protein [Ferruginibacter yonginensis]|uniref:Peptidoglycan D,D-transpeptidase FtsI family protein n=1 Tax=Ferruginibacter yonginensis TaxID=1310416 RepID=A0ABV8QV88_9BACT
MLVFVAMFLVIIAQLAHLQLFSSDLRLQADAQGTFRKVIYPDRGIVYDRHKNPILQNTIIYDLMLTPNKLKGVDTFALCKILNIDTAQFNKRVIELIIKNGRARASIFEPLLSEDKMAMINESMYQFAPAFYLQERSIRSYPYNAAANVLGYTAEVDTNFLKNHPNEGYTAGDYAGRTGIERTYEKVLMGERGIEYWKRDNKNRLTEKLENGKYDTMPKAGQNLYTTLDMELQELGEKLMENKLGSIVAIDPKTGGILAMVSAPTYKPTFLTGKDRKKHIAELLLNPALPLLNRTVSATYSPGSTFKTLQALVGLHEGVIDPNFSVSCGGAFYGCGSGKPMKCLDFGTFNLRSAITVSDNTYFATVMQKVINNPKYPNVDSSLAAWDRYMYAFGLGHKLGVDVPSEKRGNIPTPAYFNDPKRFGPGNWNYCSFRSVSIGQGEVDVTPIQVANEMCYIANKGWYITPHIVDSIEGGDKYDILSQYRKHHQPIDIPDSIFDVVHDGMQGVLERGTGGGARVKGINICGKTGTVENYFRGVKQENHSFFCAFAPRENPKIAIMCVVENSGRFGGTYAAPIVGLMIEKYLNDSIVDKGRLAQVEKLQNTKLIPKRIYAEMRKQDSLRHSKDSAYLLANGYIKIIRDTTEISDDGKDDDAISKMIKEKDSKNKKDSNDQKKPMSTEAILPNDKKKSSIADSITKVDN